MAKESININSVQNGWSTSDYINEDGYFLSSVGVDPDMPATDTGSKPSAYLRPTATSKFSGTEITGVPMWFLTNTKTEDIHLYANDGKVHTINSDLTMGTALNSGNALSSASGNGAAYYDNYLYFAKNTDIARYGPLNGTPSLNETYWTSTLSKTALNDTGYPSVNGIELPNHVMHRHKDDRLYFADVVGGKGVLHFIETSKSSTQGDTDNGSTYNALDFDYDEYPTAIETYQSDLVIGLMKGTSNTTIQKPAKIAFWDGASDSFSSITSVELADPIITAMKNVNGSVYVFSGMVGGGCRVSLISSSYRIKEVMYLPEIRPPFPGAVDHFLNRVVWGGNTVEPETSASVFSYGAKESNLAMGVHNPIRATASGSNPITTAVKYVDQSSGTIVQPIIGWADDSEKGLDKISTSYGDNNVWRSDVFIVNNRFQVSKIRIGFVQALTSNHALKVKVIGDSGYITSSTDNQTEVVIDGSNNEGQRYVEIYPQREFENNFFLQLEWEGSDLLTVAMPIQMQITYL